MTLTGTESANIRVRYVRLQIPVITREVDRIKFSFLISTIQNGTQKIDFKLQEVKVNSGLKESDFKQAKRKPEHGYTNDASLGCTNSIY